jgi:hypothetical protein
VLRVPGHLPRDLHHHFCHFSIPSAMPRGASPVEDASVCLSTCFRIAEILDRPGLPQQRKAAGTDVEALEALEKVPGSICSLGAS